MSGSIAVGLVSVRDALRWLLSCRTMTIENMKRALRRADCLYDNTELWKQLGATKVPKIPDTVIQEAWEKGGRVILRCSSISKKTDALREAGHGVGFYGDAEQQHYQESVSDPEWIVVASRIDRATLGSPKSKVITAEMPAPTTEDWFAVIAYARLDGRRQPKGCIGKGLTGSACVFTTEVGTFVFSRRDDIGVERHDYEDYDRYGSPYIGAARFGPPRN